LTRRGGALKTGRSHITSWGKAARTRAGTSLSGCGWLKGTVGVMVR